MVDLAGEQGGNCDLTVPGEVVVKEGVTIIGYTNLPSRLVITSYSIHYTKLYEGRRGAGLAKGHVFQSHL